MERVFSGLKSAVDHRHRAFQPRIELYACFELSSFIQVPIDYASLRILFEDLDWQFFVSVASLVADFVLRCLRVWNFFVSQKLHKRRLRRHRPRRWCYSWTLPSMKFCMTHWRSLGDLIYLLRHFCWCSSYQNLEKVLHLDFPITYLKSQYAQNLFNSGCAGHSPLIEELGLSTDGVGCLPSPGQSSNSNGLVDNLSNPVQRAVQPVGMVTVGTQYDQSFEAVFDTGKHSSSLPSRPESP